MRILAFDPGAERCGCALIEDGPILAGSNVYGLHRDPKVTYQAHRLLLIDYWVTTMRDLLKMYKPNIVVNEIIPSPQGINYGRLAQMNLAATVITTIQSLCFYATIPVVQIGANTVKKQLTGNKDATKVKVRNSVIERFPEFKEKASSKIFDESDAIAIGLAYYDLYS